MKYSVGDCPKIGCSSMTWLHARPAFNRAPQSLSLRPNAYVVCPTAKSSHSALVENAKGSHTRPMPQDGHVGFTGELVHGKLVHSSDSHLCEETVAGRLPASR